MKLKRFNIAVLIIALLLNVVTGIIPVRAEGEPPVPSEEVWLDGAKGNDSNDGSQANPVQTFNKAKALVNEGGIIKVITLKENDGIVLDKKATMELTQDLTMSGGSNGITLKNGGKLTAPGHTLTMSGYKERAMFIQAGGILGDGTYNLSGSHGIQIQGTGLVEGSEGRDRLKLVSTDDESTNFIITGGSHETFKNATVEITSKSEAKIGSGWGGLFGAWVDTGNGTLNLDNVDMTVKGIGGGFHMTPNINNSTLTIDKYQRDIKTALTAAQSGQINDSNIIINTGWQAGISFEGSPTVDINNSTITFNEQGTGGLNVATGQANINNSIIQGHKVSALIGTGISGPSGKINVDTNSFLINTNPKGVIGGSSSNSDKFAIAGGLYFLNASNQFNTKTGETKGADPFPVNTAGEKLNLFSLKDSNPQEITVPLKNGGEYVYTVPAIPSSLTSVKDMQPYVWLPPVLITFDPNGGEYADGTNQPKEVHAARGLSLDAITSWNAVPTPDVDAPSQIGKKFEGWFYKDDVSTKFDRSQSVTKDSEVIAKWSEDPNSYGILYNNNNFTGEADHSLSLQVAGDNENRTETILSYEDLITKNNAFKRTGYIFKGWSLEKDGSGKLYQPGESIEVPTQEKSLTLYAQYTPDIIKVKFHANGGTFKDGTIFKNEKVFTLEDEGQTAVLNGVILSGTKLLDAIKALDSSVRTLPPELKSDSEELIDKINPPNLKDMVVSREDKGSFLGITWDDKYYAWYPNENVDEKKAKAEALTIDQNTILDGNKDYYLAWKVRDGVPKKEFAVPLTATMYVNDNTKGNPQTIVRPGDDFDVSATLDVGAVKNQLLQYQNLFSNGNELSDIHISDLKTEFVGTMTLAEGLTPQQDLTPEQISTEGFNGFFEVSEVNVDGQKVIVTMRVKDPKAITNFEMLKNELLKTGNGQTPGSDGYVVANDLLKITVPGITVNKNADLNKEYPIPGTFTGKFDALSSINDHGIEFILSWNSETQTGVKTVNQMIQDLNMIVEGDILVDTDTEHENVYSVKNQQSIDYTGRLYIQSVKDKINAMKSIYEGESDKDTSNILLKNVQSEFTAVLTLGEGLEVKDPSKVTADLDLHLDGKTPDAKPLFKIKSTTYNPQNKTITINMVLNQEYGKFDDLWRDVNAAGGSGDKPYLDVIVKGVSVNATSGQQTVTGTVTGWFKGIAITNSGSGNSRGYDFFWKAEQILDNPNGQDAILKGDTSNKTIQFTSEVKPEPDNPDKPEPSKPSTSGKHHHSSKVTVVEPVKDDKLDIENHYAYMFGYPDATFRPERQMTRAEVAAMFARLMKYQPAETKEFPVSYNDVNKDDWYFRAVEFMKENGIVTGYPDGSFKPNGYITRAEFATMASRFDNLAQNTANAFTDVTSDYWGAKYINSAVAKGWINGYPDGTFKPEKDITRAEVVTVTNHMLYREADKEFVDRNEDKLIKFVDLTDKNYWAYYNIREATDGHEFHRKGKGVAEVWEELNHKAFRFAVVGRDVYNN